ncbi:hypothetical protein J2Y45_000399 [Dyadobacter sp. BE34]|uniref:Uncharacterized protein n=1 Tax=Dyadobacter fermentans TaxID=94254 RepID=A0ABU1QPQ2_9BACT|nr:MULTISPECIES: hypothetical protein [Dyadobacter]MDR6803129.1 hypothetical protein [Dyadobacter fermentans]MDR7040871.1 hypothetical protein [Dyadobacter sp. BE242]MDR7195273.1 hypothetical protein [Dyadobacter sp. BE34]MDR7214181.1 hypothetical protein [Dyadobacter sp. BE31]MDR7260681.1 hypothetical protein [Dyadobacter sp. BE32]
MAILTLHSDHYDDIEDLIASVKSEFNVKFDNDDFVSVKSVGQLFDVIVNKVPLSNSETCTSQQAFYKLREAFSNLDSVCPIQPATPLEDLLPRQGRISTVKALERELGMALNILSPPQWLSNIIWTAGFVTIGGLFYDTRIFLPLLLAVILIGKIAYQFGKELDHVTVADLARHLTRNNYLVARRNPDTINRKELSQILLDRLNLNYDEEGRLVMETAIG